MKRGVFDVLRRGVDNTIANWQLVLIRIGEMLLFGVLTVQDRLAGLPPIPCTEFKSEVASKKRGRPVPKETAAAAVLREGSRRRAP